MVWFGLVLWHINHCLLFKAKSCFYINIKYMILNTFCRYTQLNGKTVLFLIIQFSISQQSVLNPVMVNGIWTICFHRLNKGFNSKFHVSYQVRQGGCISRKHWEHNKHEDNSLNTLYNKKYCYVSLTIQLNISHLSPHS